MAVRKRSKSWSVVVDVGRDPITGKRLRRHASAPTKKEAQLEEARLRQEAGRGIRHDASRITVREYLSDWLKTMEANLTPRTFSRYESLVNHQMIPRIGSMKLGKLEATHLKQLYTELRRNGRVDGRGLSSSSILQVHRVLSQALKHAVWSHLISVNPAQMVKAPRIQSTEHNTLSKDQARGLLDTAAAEDSVYGDCIILALHTGMRMGELLGLQWKDVDLDGERLTVRRSLQFLDDGGFKFQQPKTAKSRRTIPLTKPAVAALHRCRRRQAELRLMLGSAYSDHELVFASSVGTPISHANMRRALARILKIADLPRIRFHDLRHSHASLMLALGVHPKVVSERLGHASIVITLDTYSHTIPTLQEEAVRDFDEWMSAHAETA